MSADLEKLKTRLDTLTLPVLGYVKERLPEGVSVGSDLRDKYVLLKEALHNQRGGDRKSLDVTDLGGDVSYIDVNSIAGLLAKAGYTKEANFLHDVGHAAQARGELFTSGVGGKTV